ncbi:MAG: hypothetical protein OXG24_06890 [Gammaproteobacteria bacterium]|nr:hypothetical protein [Gammaproteobacteria bacterium]
MRNSGMLSAVVGTVLTLCLTGCVNMSDYSTQSENTDALNDSEKSTVSANVDSEEKSSASFSESPNYMSTHQREQKFSFLNPDSFHLADESQRKILKDIYRSEFDLSHLGEEEKTILTDALSKSGIEVQTTCVVSKETTAKVGAFFRKWNMNQTTRYFPPTPDAPYTHLIEETDLSDKKGQETKKSALSADASDYPYPLSEVNAVIKLVPVNLSSTLLLDRTAETVTYEALPSALLFANLSEQDQLWTVEDGHVVFNIDLQTNRLNWLKYELKAPVKVYNFVRISGFQLDYQFEENEELGRNVVRSVEHSMRGRLALLFTPNLQISNSFSYDSCSTSPPTDSYLFRSMSAIARL